VLCFQYLSGRGCAIEACGRGRLTGQFESGYPDQSQWPPNQMGSLFEFYTYQ
jgi:hypothetical protein